MLLHIRPRLFSPFRKPALVELTVEPLGLHLRGTDLASRRIPATRQASGVYGYASGGIGVAGDGAAVGVNASNESTTNGATALYAGANGISGITYGVLAVDKSSGGYAGYFSNSSSGAGYVGIGSTTPAATLDVAGPVKVAGTGSETCSASTVGAMRYNAAGNYMEICSYP